jgi:phosphatidylinositol alpha-1,6-mannosyltransferase
VLTEHFLPVKGGSVRWLLNTYSRYQPAEVLVVAAPQPGDTLVDQALPFRVKRLPMAMADWDPTVPASLCCYLRLLWGVYTLCHQSGVQQVHCAKVLPEGLVAWVLHLCNGTPYLLYAHGEEILSALTSRKLAWLLPRIYRRAAAIIANSRHTQALLQDLGVPAAKIHLIHPGVDAQAFGVSPAAVQRLRQKYHLGESPVLLTVGRMQRRKGQDMVLHALPYVAHAIPAVRYVLVGTGEELASLQGLARRLGVAERVIFAGEVSEQDLPVYYAACDLFIMPNRQIDADIEGFGIVFLEAGAASKPVIGGRSGGTADAIVHEVTGLRVDGADVAAIATAVVSLLTDPAKAQAMGAAGRRRVEQEFTWEAVVEQTRRLSTTVPRKIR